MKKRVILLALACCAGALTQGYSLLPLTASALEDKSAIEALHELSHSKIGDTTDAKHLLKAREAITLERLGLGYQYPGSVWLTSRLPAFRDAEIHYSSASSILSFSFPAKGRCVSESDFAARFSDVPRNPYQIWSWHASKNRHTFDGYVILGGVKRRVFATFYNSQHCLSTFSLDGNPDRPLNGANY